MRRISGRRIRSFPPRGEGGTEKGGEVEKRKKKKKKGRREVQIESAWCSFGMIRFLRKKKKKEKGGMRRHCAGHY